VRSLFWAVLRPVLNKLVPDSFPAACPRVLVIPGSPVPLQAGCFLCHFPVIALLFLDYKTPSKPFSPFRPVSEETLLFFPRHTARRRENPRDTVTGPPQPHLFFFFRIMALFFRVSPPLFLPFLQPLFTLFLVGKLVPAPLSANKDFCPALLSLFPFFLFSPFFSRFDQKVSFQRWPHFLPPNLVRPPNIFLFFPSSCFFEITLFFPYRNPPCGFMPSASLLSLLLHIFDAHVKVRVFFCKVLFGRIHAAFPTPV